MELNSGGSSEMQPHPSNPNSNLSNEQHPHSQLHNAQQQQQNPSLQFVPCSNIDPYAVVISYNNTTHGHVGEGGAYAAQATVMAYTQQPTQTGVLSEHAYYQDPAAYSAEIKSLDENTTVPTKSSPQETNVIKPMTCEVCRIGCNSKKALDRHKKGKKHKMNLVKQAELSKDSTAISNTPMTLETTEEKGLPAEDTKIMQAGAAANSVVVCNVCKVTCNSESVFQNHIAGKKHAAQVKKEELGKDSTLPAISKILTTPETTKNRSLPDEDSETKKQNAMEAGAVNSAKHAAQEKKEELGEDSTTPAISKMLTTPETTKNRGLPGEDLETEKQNAMEAGAVNSAKHAAQVKKEELGEDSTTSAISKMLTTPETTKNRGLPGEDLEKEKQNAMEAGAVNSAKHAAEVKKEELGKDSTAPAISKMLTTPDTDRGLPGEDLETEKQNTMEAGAVNSARVCTLCKVTCSSQLEFEYHITGKKHAAQVKKELGKDSTTPVISERPSTPKKTNKRGLPGEDLETKKRKIMEAGTAVGSVMVCTVCEVACNSQSALNFHLAGKKHALQAGLTPPNGMEQMMPANLNPDYMTAAPMVQPPTKRSTENEPKEIKMVQSAWCEICKIACTTKDVLDIHRAGKKHKKNLKKLEEQIKPSVDATTSTNPIIETQENTNPSSSSSVEVQQTNKRPASSTVPAEDVETKRRKLMEVGATEDSVRVCTICNIAVNSETVFRYHLSGQKHASMVKKQADGKAAAAATGPEVHAAQVKKEELGEDSTTSSISKMLTTPETTKNRGLPGEDLETEKQNAMEAGAVNSAKHAAEVKKEELGKDSTAPAISKMLTTPDTDRGLLGEDLETEKQNTMEAGAVNSARVCTLYKVTCSSQLEFEYHITGKKHAAQVKKEELGKDSTTPVISEIPSNPKKTSKRGLPGEDLETKKRKIMEAGTAVGSVMVCTVCEVACNSQSALNFHLAGKKHALQAELTPPNGMAQMMPANLNPDYMTANPDYMTAAPMVQPPTKRSTKNEPTEIKMVQSAWCEICKIACNTKDVFDIHRAGKKHKKNLKKLEEQTKPSVDATPSTNPIIGTQDKPIIIKCLSPGN